MRDKDEIIAAIQRLEKKIAKFTATMLPTEVERLPDEDIVFATGWYDTATEATALQGLRVVGLAHENQK